LTGFIRVTGKQAKVAIFEFFTEVFSCIGNISHKELKSIGIKFIAQLFKFSPKGFYDNQSRGDGLFKDTDSLVIKLDPHFFS